MSGRYSIITLTLGGLLFTGSTFASVLRHQSSGDPVAVTAKLSEWKVELSEAKVSAGPVTFTVTNTGAIPHAFEVEGEGIEQQTALLQPGSSAILSLTLQPGTYEIYCPVGENSHKKLGMETHLKVVTQPPAPAKVQAIQVTGGGPVIQILPGPFPFADSAAGVLKSFGDEKEGLESQAQNGPYSNNVTPITGSFSFSAWDKGDTRDSVDGIAEFTTKDRAHWKLVLDRVQTKDVPHHPRFGGVIMGLYYHGMTGVHTPLVPTINSAVALWAFGRLYRNGTLVTDNAMVHVMQLSRTRRDGDFALACWDCSKNKIEELQLQILPGKAEPKFDAPGGFLFVNWEKSRATSPSPTGTIRR
jgi:plastocyanin